MEEVVQTLVEEDALIGDRGHYRLETAPAALHIPQTVQGILAARIDRLSVEEKTFLQQLAVIGRQFPASLIKHVVPQPEDDLYRILTSLQAKEFLYEQPAFPEVEYIFKHALTQDVAYGTVLQEQRKSLHERTAQALESLYSDSLEDHYSELAHHYSHSENTRKAVEYLGLAGQKAVQHLAHEEGSRCFITASELLSESGETPNRARLELPLQTAPGETLYVHVILLCKDSVTTTPCGIARTGFCMAYTLGSRIWPVPVGACGIWGIRTKPCNQRTKRRP